MPICFRAASSTNGAAWRGSTTTPSDPPVSWCLEGAGFPVGSARTRLSLEPAGREILDIARNGGPRRRRRWSPRSIASSRRGPMRNARRPKPKRARAPPRLASRARIELRGRRDKQVAPIDRKGDWRVRCPVGPNSPRPRHKLILRRFYLVAQARPRRRTVKRLQTGFGLKHAADRPFSRLPFCDLRDGLRDRRGRRRGGRLEIRAGPSRLHPASRTTSRR